MFQLWSPAIPMSVVKEAVELLFGRSRQAKVLAVFLKEGRLTLAEVARELDESLAMTRLGWDGGVYRKGWIGQVVREYVENGVLLSAREGNRVVYELNRLNPCVLLMEELKRNEKPGRPPRSSGDRRRRGDPHSRRSRMSQESAWGG